MSRFCSTCNDNRTLAKEGSILCHTHTIGCDLWSFLTEGLGMAQDAKMRKAHELGMKLIKSIIQARDESIKNVSYPKRDGIAYTKNH